MCPFLLYTSKNFSFHFKAKKLEQIAVYSERETPQNEAQSRVAAHAMSPLTLDFRPSN